MSYPIDAFVRAAANTLPKGRLVYVRDFWTLTAEIEVPTGLKKKSLVLTGTGAGLYLDAYHDHNGLAVAAGVSLELRVADPSSRIADDTYPSPGAIVVSEDGTPQIWVRHPDSEHARKGFRLDGEEVVGEEHTHRPFVYFKTYEVWLTRDGKALSDKPLFTVG